MKDHAVIVLRDGDKVLFVQRAATKRSLPNLWAFPSGTIEEGETAEMTASREAREELGIRVEAERTLAVVHIPEVNARLHFVLCRQTCGRDIVCDPAEIQDAAWHTFDEFYRKCDDSRLAHGLIYVREHPEIWRPLFGSDEANI